MLLSSFLKHLSGCHLSICRLMMWKMFINNKKPWYPPPVTVGTQVSVFYYIPYVGLNGVQFCDCSCSCVYFDCEFGEFVFSTLRSRSCFTFNQLFPFNLGGVMANCYEWTSYVFFLFLFHVCMLRQSKSWIIPNSQGPETLNNLSTYNKCKFDPYLNC